MWLKHGCKFRSSNSVGRVQLFPGWSRGTGGCCASSTFENMKILLGSGNENSGLVVMLNSVLPEWQMHTGDLRAEKVSEDLLSSVQKNS